MCWRRVGAFPHFLWQRQSCSSSSFLRVGWELESGRGILAWQVLLSFSVVLQHGRDEILVGGSWVGISGAISKVTILTAGFNLV